MASFFTIHEASNDSTDLFWLARRPDCIQAVAKRLSLPELFDFCTLSREEYIQFMLDSHFVDSIDELASDMRKAIEDAPEEIPWVRRIDWIGVRAECLSGVGESLGFRQNILRGK